MTAHVYPTTDWFRAGAKRASAGRSPRLAVLRLAVLQQGAGGQWRVAVMERRYGVWKTLEALCAYTSYDKADAVLRRAWRKHRLPLAQLRLSDRRLRPLHINRPEPIGGAS